MQALACLKERQLLKKHIKQPLGQLFRIQQNLLCSFHAPHFQRRKLYNRDTGYWFLIFLDTVVFYCFIDRINNDHLLFHGLLKNHWRNSRHWFMERICFDHCDTCHFDFVFDCFVTNIFLKHELNCFKDWESSSIFFHSSFKNSSMNPTCKTPVKSHHRCLI